MESDRPDPPERCPECGWGLGEEAVVYVPSALTQFGWWFDVVIIFYVVTNGYGAVRFFRGSQWVLSAFLGGAVMMMLYVLGKRGWLRRNGPAVAQARFGPRGFARRGSMSFA